MMKELLNNIKNIILELLIINDESDEMIYIDDIIEYNELD